MDKSHELIQLEICEHRGIKLDAVIEKRHQYLKKGFEGECTVYEWFQTYSNGKLNIITDYWFNHGKDMQVDLLVILNNRWVVIEVKNYFGHFEYRNHNCYLRGKLMSDNYFTQLVHRTQRLQHIATDFNPDIKVESAMVFIDEHCEVSILSDISTRVVQRNQLRSFIKSLTNEQPTRSMNQVVRHLDKYRVASPFQPIYFESEKVASEVRRGVTCSNCRSFNTYTTQQYIKCKICNHYEYKYLAVSELALELRYIHYYDPSKITSRRLFEFCGKKISQRTIIRALASKFKYVEKGPKSYYEVPLLNK